MNGSTINPTCSSNLTSMKNTSQQQQQPLFQKTPIWTATAVILSLMIIAIIAGNVLVLLTTWLDKRLHQPNKYFIACLAVADLLVGLFSVPIRLSIPLDHMKLWPIDLCRFWLWMDSFCEIASIATLTVISADRYFKISEPFRYTARMNTRKSVIVIVNVWLIAAITATFGMFSYDGDDAVKAVLGRGCVSDNQIYYTIIAVVFFFIPSVIIILMYTLIFYIAHERHKMNRRGALGQSFASSESKRGNEFRKELKTIRMLALVVCTFMICWAPAFSMILIGFYKPEYLRALTLHDHQIIGSIFVVILPSFNSLCNPVIYACFDREYSSAFKHVLKKYIICQFLFRRDRKLSQTSRSTTRSTVKNHSSRSIHSTRNSSSSRLMFELQENPSEGLNEK